MITRLTVTPAVRDDLFAHARAGGRDQHPGSRHQPELAEVCGVLGGERRQLVDEADATTDRSDESERAVVTDCRRVPNVADGPQFRYELDPAATVDAIEALEADGLDHLGFYHSHPRGPRGPSRTDQAQATWPGYVYLIVSLADEPVVGAWRWTGGSFVQLPIDVESD